MKYYAREDGSDWVASIIDANDIVIASITVVEVVSAIERKKRSGKVTFTDAGVSVADYTNHILGEYPLVAIDRLILFAAALAEKHGLRGYDSVQLATALDTNESRVSNNLSGIIFVSADDKLNEAAKVEGLSVENPNNH